MKLEIRRIWSDGYWDVEFITPPVFITRHNISKDPTIWRSLESWCRDKLLLRSKYRKCVDIHPLEVYARDST